MTDLLILGTDTDAGKTTFAVLWLAAFPEEFAYWKPVESGDSDTEKIRQLVPQARCFPAGMRFAQPVAPPLAALGEGRFIPSATALSAMKPAPSVEGGSLLIETFGGPFSPLNDNQLQIALIRDLSLPALLVGSSALGAIGRTLKCLYALKQDAVQPFAVVLMGARDEYAARQIARYGQVPVFFLATLAVWDKDSVREAADRQRATLEKIREAFVLASHAATFPVTAGDAAYGARPTDFLDEDLTPIPKSPKWAKEQAAAIADLARSIGTSSAAHVDTRPTTAPVGMSRDKIADLLAADARNVWHPYTSLRDPDPPLLAVSARDEFLHLADGRKLIDGISSWWTILHGHRHPVLMKALADAAQDFDHVHFAGVTHPHAIKLAEMLMATAPWPGGRVFYSDNGSTAVEVALKMAYQFWCHRGEPQRTLFVGFQHGYHGDTFGAMAASRDPVFFGRFEPLLFRSEIIPLEAGRLQETLAANKGKVAAVILEPLVQGAGGMRMHAPEELRDIFEVARKHDVLFVADEVMTGGGRLGPLWAHSLAGIAPDLICAAKTLTGGVLPLAATLAAPQVVAAFDTDDRAQTFFHGHSFTANPLACAVAVASWQLLTAAPLSDPPRLEAFWKEALAPLRHHPRIRDLRIRGTLAAVELEAPGGYLADIGRQLRRFCLEQGVLLRPLGNVLYALPPLCASTESLRQIAAAITGAVQSL